jgi:2-polyprenyl-3-methyl-5-hydroxy-6-metoxy-1,4-benzoquinol methylase
MNSESGPRKVASPRECLQGGQYSFPYHYIPSLNSYYLSRHWNFASSYIAAIKICTNTLSSLLPRDREWSHIDIGCGDGAFLKYVGEELGCEMIRLSGMDTDENAIGWANMFNSSLMISCKDIFNEKEIYDSASLIEVIEHIPPSSLSGFINEVGRVLSPRGVLLVTVPSTNKPVASKHYQHFTAFALRRVLEESFEIKQLFGFEKYTFLARLLEKVRCNKLARIDSPRINRIIIASLEKLHRDSKGCGRLYAVCVKRDKHYEK